MKLFSEEDSKINMIMNYIYFFKTKKKLIKSIFLKKIVFSSDNLKNIIFSFKIIKKVIENKNIEKYISLVKKYFLNKFNINIFSKQNWKNLEEKIFQIKTFVEKQDLIFNILNGFIIIMIFLKNEKRKIILKEIKKKIYFFLDNINFNTKSILNYINKYFPI